MDSLWTSQHIFPMPLFQAKSQLWMWRPWRHFSIWAILSWSSNVYAGWQFPIMMNCNQNLGPVDHNNWLMGNNQLPTPESNFPTIDCSDSEAHETTHCVIQYVMLFICHILNTRYSICKTWSTNYNLLWIEPSSGHSVILYMLCVLNCSSHCSIMHIV